MWSLQFWKLANLFLPWYIKNITRRFEDIIFNLLVRKIFRNKAAIVKYCFHHLCAQEDKIHIGLSWNHCVYVFFLLYNCEEFEHLFCCFLVVFLFYRQKLDVVFSLNNDHENWFATLTKVAILLKNANYWRVIILRSIYSSVKI